MCFHREGGLGPREEIGASLAIRLGPCICGAEIQSKMQAGLAAFFFAESLEYLFGFFFLLFQQLPLWGHVLLIHRSPFQTLLRRLIRRKSIHWWVLRKKAFDLTAGQDSSDYHGPSWQQGGQAALALPRVVVEWSNHVVCITIFQLFRVERGERHQKW